MCLPLGAAPEASGALVADLYAWLASRLGAAYLWAGVATLVFALWLALSRHGRTVLGEDGVPADYAFVSWFSMLFCAGIASGLLYWGVIEWVFYDQAPPPGVEPGSDEALAWAGSYPLFHWGFTAWAFYALPTVAVAHACHRRGEGSLRLSRACRPVLGGRADGAFGRAIDVLFIVGILGGASTSLGLATPMIAQGASELFGLARTASLDVGIVLGCGAIFATSVYLGLDRGIRMLSNLNIVLAIGFIVFVLFASDTAFILERGAASVLHGARHFGAMNWWTGSALQIDWTVFYWAWWIAYAPFVGLFVARISRGRTIREVVFGMILAGTAVAWLFFIVLGNHALALERSGELGVIAMTQDVGAPHAIIAVISALPGGALTLAVFCFVALLYLATTFDSAAYTIATGASLSLDDEGHPERLHRSFWALSVAALPIVLMAVGGLRSLQTASLVASVPLLGVFVVLAIALVRALRADPRRRD